MDNAKIQPVFACHPWLPVLAPMRLMLIAVLLVLCQSLLAVRWLQQQPFFHLPLTLQGEQVMLGKQAVQYLEFSQQRWRLPAHHLLPDPDFVTSFAELERFLAEQHALFQSLTTHQNIAVVTQDNRTFHFSRTPRTLADISLDFWLYQALGAAGLLIGTAFWAFHRGRAIPRLLAIAGAGFALMEWSMALYAAREIALGEQQFRTLLALNHLGGMLFGAGTVGLLLFYPKRLGSVQFLYFSATTLLLCWLNEWGQWIEWPIHPFYCPALALLAAFILFSVQQYIACFRQTLLRLQLFALLLPVIIGLGVAFTLYILPRLFNKTSWLSLPLANGITLLVLAGFILGVQRQELFGVHRWWLRSWFITGLLALALTADLLTALTLTHHTQLGLGLMGLLLGWGYWGMRQWIWQRCVQSQHTARLPMPPSLNRLITQLNPLHIAHFNHAPDAWNASPGLTLTIASSANSFWLLSGKHRGFALFDAQDGTLAEQTLLTESESMQQQTQLQTLQRDRERLMRDLHDDVAADLLTLLHQADNETRRQQVQDTLLNLRGILRGLQDIPSTLLEDNAARWQADTRQRCCAAGVQLEWQQGILIESPINIDIIQHLHRILREVISNALRHARPSRISVNLSCQANTLHLRVSDDGQHTSPNQWRPGIGLRSLQRRALAINAHIQWRLLHTPQGELCEFQLQLPLTTSSPLMESISPHEKSVAA